MNNEFAKAMRRSLQQTRAGDPVAATRLIQEALQGGPRGDNRQPGNIVAQLPKSRAPGRDGAGRSFESEVEDAEVIDSTPPRRNLREVIAGLSLRPHGFASSISQRPEDRVMPEVPTGARFERRQFSGPTGARDYRLYLPSTYEAGIEGLIVMLHGCTQSPEDFAAGTEMNALAERHGLAVAWPEQARTHNSSLCWNWFRPQDQGRSGEPAILNNIAKLVAAEFSAPHVFVAGLSAGGAMSAILAQTYPETFTAAGVHSGLAPGSAQDVVSAFATMRGDAAPRAEAVRRPLIVFQGTADRTVAPVNADRLTGTLSERAVRSGRSSGRRFTVAEGQNAAGAPVELWSIEGAGHAWSGGSAYGSYTDPAGPDASSEMIRFFLANGRRPVF